MDRYNNDNQPDLQVRQQTSEASDRTWYAAPGVASTAMPDSGHLLPASEAIVQTSGKNVDQSQAAFQFLSPTQFTRTTIWASVHADVFSGEEEIPRPPIHDIVNNEPAINTALVGVHATLRPFRQEVAETLNHNALSDRRSSIRTDTRCAPQNSQISQNPRIPESINALQVTENCGDPAYLHRRKRRCLCCKADKGNRPCLGYPLCQRCSVLPGIQATPPTLGDVPYLDWRLWFLLCRDLGESIAPFREKYLDASPLPFETLAPIVLDLVLEDRIWRQSLENHYLVVFQPHLTKQSFIVGSGTDQTLVRAPAICIPQLDLFVMKSMWGEVNSLETSHRLSDDENALFSTAGLFTGYFCLLHNIGNIKIDSGSAFEFTLGQFLSTEMIYTLAFRLQMLFSEFATLCTKISQENAEKKNDRKAHTVVVLYALEVVYRVVVSMKTCTWDVPADNPFHPLFRLWTGFKRQSHNILSRILAYECYYSELTMKESG